MRKEPNVKAEKWRTSPNFGVIGKNAGAFEVAYKDGPFGVVIPLRVIVGNGGGWDHVSVSTPTRTPTWAEMCFIKDLFFKDEEWVMQLHQAKSDYVNLHPNVLHMWRPQTEEERAVILAEFEKDLAEATGEEKSLLLKLSQIERAPTPGPIPLPPKAMV